MLREKSLIIGIGWNGGCTKCKRAGGGGGVSHTEGGGEDNKF